MGEWQTERLENCLASLIDYRGKSPPKSDQGIPVLSAKVVKTGGILHPVEQTIAPDYYAKWMTRGLPQPGDVVMTTEAPLGEVIQLDEETAKYALGQRIVCMRGVYGKLDNTFLRYLLSSPLQQNLLASYATGTTVLGISQKALRAMPISFPYFNEQQDIGALLGALDDKIELNRRMNATLEAMARALFKDWFVDFGPTRAKMAGRPAYLAPDLWSLFPDRVDDETGLPEGWATKPLGECLERLKVGKLYDQTSVAPSGKVPVLDQGKSGFIGFHDNDPNLQASAQRRISIFANHTCFQRLVDFNFSTIQNVIPFVGRGVPTEWIHYASLGKQTFEEYRGHWPSFVTHEIVVPGRELAERFAQTVHSFLRKASALDAESTLLAETRDFLLPKLMSGELRLGDAEKPAEEAA